MRIAKQIALATYAIVALLWQSCSQPVAVPSKDSIFDAQTSGVGATYDYQQGVVVISWDTLPNVDFYSLQRYLDTLDDGSPVDVKETLIPAGSGRNGSSIIFKDVPSLARSAHFYMVVPGKYVNDDTLLGMPSPPVMVNTGKGIRLKFNDGAPTTETKNINISVEDRRGVIKSIRFSQIQLQTAGTATPLFNFSSADDPQNFQQQYVQFDNPGIPKYSNYTWLLNKGPQIKKVYALIDFYPLDGQVFKPETLMTQIIVAPHFIKAKFEHEFQIISTTIADENSPDYRSGTSGATAIKSTFTKYGSADSTQYTFNSHYIDFSVSIGGDSTMSQTFDAWIIFPDNSTNLFDIEKKVLKAPLCATAPQRFELTGRGKYHDENHRYRYSLDIDSLQGKSNFRYCVPIGINMVTTYPYVENSAIDTNTLRDVSENYKKFLTLGTQKTFGYGQNRKPFILVLKFIGNQFDEERYYFSSSDLFPGKKGQTSSKEPITRSYFDFYVPDMKLLPKSSPYFITNGDTITNSLDFRLDELTSVVDGGFARVTKLQLIIAAKPDGIVWDYRKWTGESDVPQIKIEDLKKNNYSIKDFSIPTPFTTLRNVAWDPVDLSSMPSGQYFIAIVAADEFGNEGFARLQFSNNATNPFEVTILSGK
jgi:hypothetical protein